VTSQTTEDRRPAVGSKLAVTAMCLGFFVIQLDATIINVALPTIGQSLHGGSGDLQWIVAGYTIALAALMLTAGGLADQFGARRLFLTGMVVFAAASAACGLANDLPVLITARVIQGIGAALLLPCSLALITHEFPDTGSRAKVLGVWGAFGSLGMASGPLFGGLLLSVTSWRAIFLVNVPIAAVTVALLLRTVSETKLAGTKAIDRPGVVLGSLSLGSLAGGFIQAGHNSPVAPGTLALAAVGVLAGAAFVAWERRTAQPMVPPRLFSSRNFTSSAAIGFLFNFSLYGALLTMSLFLQHQLHYSALLTGCALFPMTLSVGLGSVLSGRLTARSGPRGIMIAGLLAAAIGAVVVSFAASGTTGIVVFVVGSVLLGLCALAMPAMTSVAVGAVRVERAGLASGVFNTARQAGGAIGVALLGSLLSFGHTLVQVPMLGAAAGLVLAAGLALKVKKEAPLEHL
jgi:DHA2 family methylenomycin A resistance protein-like MFS transporter